MVCQASSIVLLWTTGDGVRTGRWVRAVGLVPSSRRMRLQGAEGLLCWLLGENVYNLSLLQPHCYK